MSLPPLTVPTVPFCAPSQACKPQAECHRELPAGQASFGEVAQSGQGPGRHAAVSRLGCWHLEVQGQPVALWLVLCGPGGGGGVRRQEPRALGSQTQAGNPGLEMGLSSHRALGESWLLPRVSASP